MGPHRICMCFVFRNMLTLSLSLSIGTNEATPLATRTRLLPCFVQFSFLSSRDFSPRDTWRLWGWIVYLRGKFFEVRESLSIQF